MSLFVTYHIDVTIVLFCRACITHSTPSLSMLFSDNLTGNKRAETGWCRFAVHTVRTQMSNQALRQNQHCVFSLHIKIFCTTYQSSSSDTLFLIMLARAQAPALPILLPTRLS